MPFVESQAFIEDMRTYYLHGKITDTSFHMKASLSKKPPAGYYLIGDIAARTISHAVISACRISALAPDNINLRLTDAVQTSFIQKE